MDFLWVQAVPFLLIAIFCTAVAILMRLTSLADRVDGAEIDRHSFNAETQSTIESLQADVGELRCLLKDLIDFQKSDGRYRYDPNDPRLPAHIRDREGRDD